MSLPGAQQVQVLILPRADYSHSLHELLCADPEKPLGSFQPFQHHTSRQSNLRAGFLWARNALLLSRLLPSKEGKHVMCSASLATETAARLQACVHADSHSPLGCLLTRRATQHKQQSEEDSNFQPFLAGSGSSSSTSALCSLPL